MTKKLQSGFTLVEVIVVLGIIGILAVIGIRIVGLQKTTTFNKQVDEIVSNLRQMQSQARVVSSNLEYGMSFSNNGWTSFSNDPDANTETTIDSETYDGVTITTSLTPSATKVIFSRLTGQTKNNTSGTITVTLDSPSRTKTIQIQASGVIYVQ